MIKFSKDEDFDSDVRRMNFMLHGVLKAGMDIQYSDTKHVAKDKVFKKAVLAARKELDLTEFYPENEGEDNITKWLIERVKGVDYKAKDQKIYEAVSKANTAANLQYGWYAYTEAFIALGKEPKTTKPVHLMKLEAVGVSEDRNSIYIRMDKGLSADDYRKAWHKLKWFLSKPSTAPIYADVLKNKIYLDRQNGMTYGDLAKKYYPHEYRKDLENKTDYARDKVKKIIARFKKPM